MTTHAKVLARTARVAAMWDNVDWQRLIDTDRPSAEPAVLLSVYFIQAGATGPIKIGVSLNPLARLTELQTGHPERLTLIGTIPGGFDTERALHVRFARHRLLGEWFAPHEDLETYLTEHVLQSASH